MAADASGREAGSANSVSTATKRSDFSACSNTPVQAGVSQFSEVVTIARGHPLQQSGLLL